MTKRTPTRLYAASVVTLALAATVTGCKSGGSRWAWNPFSKSGADAAALAEAPRLPTDGATPLIEGAEPETTAVADADADAPKKTPPALGGVAPTFEAVAQATPSIDKPAPTAPNWSPYPTATEAPAAETPAMPKTQPASSTVASAGPYDPNGYQPAPTKPAAVADNATDRYGSPASYASSLPELPPIDSSATAGLGDRYGAAAASATEKADSFASSAGAVTPKGSGAAAPATGSRYPTTTPAYPTAGESTGAPAYPVASAPAAPSGSVYASKSEPITPIEPAPGESPAEPAGDGGSVVRLTTLPGEYRPGGTSTYQPTSTSTTGGTSRY